METLSTIKIPKTTMEVFEMLPEGTLCQVINNNLIMSPAPSYQHQKILGNLYAQLFEFVNKNKLGEIVMAPVDVYLDEQNAYQPDIVFLANENLHLVQNGVIKGAPDFIIEILSPFNKQHDLLDKKAVYERSGVKEYWIVDPETSTAEGYQLQQGQYQPIGTFKNELRPALFSEKISF